MKALLVKDWLTTKGLIKNYVLILLCYAILAYSNRNVYMFTGLMVMIPLLMVINSAAYDEKYKTDRWMLASGITRKQLALSKYMFSLILVGTMSCFNLLIVGVIEGFAESLVVNCLLAIVAMTYISALLPFVYRYGTEKARIYMMLGIVIPFASGFLFTAVSEILNLHISDLMIGLLLIAACSIVIAASICSSIKIVEKKDY